MGHNGVISSYMIFTSIPWVDEWSKGPSDFRVSLKKSPNVLSKL